MTDDLSRLRDELAHEREVNEKLATSNVKLRAEAAELRSRLQTVADELCDDAPFPVMGAEELIDYIEGDAHKFRVRCERLEGALEPFTKWATMFPHGVPGDLAKDMRPLVKRARAVLEETG